MSAMEARVSWTDELTEPAAHLDADLLERLRELVGRRVPAHRLSRVEGEWGPESLSPREWQVLALIAEGASDAMIGRLLYLAEDTVKSHVKNLRSKLGANNRAHAVAIVARHLGPLTLSGDRDGGSELRHSTSSNLSPGPRG